MNQAETAFDSFAIKDCAVVAIATGRRALNLRELREHLASVDPDSIYHHFWGGLLRPRFDDPEFNNDFAAWAYRGLNEGKLAERLGVIDPTDFPDLEDLRRELIDIVEERLEESDVVPWAPHDRQFNFITTHMVVFDTHKRLKDPKELVVAVPHLSLGSIFYHFIDARRRTPNNIDDFRSWLQGYGDFHEKLIQQLASVDPFFPTLAELRDELSAMFKNYFEGAPS
ncbi:MAG: hypothetical protein C4520_07155 [Candidatus Abyssobacteria bacterium SURF_5]|uniref:Uncharacterized protein n=1 Tax=Abyssobacteria bacterium (strain SURF_5) TaxID=2093360 RepID=A0A3A4NRD2_ABYX5|nr:MAG: hypothetical protein C4520_07155 [Candidatus Abyssubacteria bacterium SURF_5]